MVQKTKIGWTHYTSNPLKYRHKVTGQEGWMCIKCSSGCAHCYAEELAIRFHRGGPFTKAEMRDWQPFLGQNELRALYDLSLSGKRVFLCDMTDLFGEWVPVKLIHALFDHLLPLPE